MIGNNLTPAEFLRAEAIVDSAAVIGVYGACAWDELHDDGMVWIATIIREAYAGFGAAFVLQERWDAIPTLPPIIFGDDEAARLTAGPAVHTDDVAVDLFAALMKYKLATSRRKGRGGWNDHAQCTADHLRQLLHEHIAKGDPVDVANFAMMLTHRGASTAASPRPPEQADDSLATAKARLSIAAVKASNSGRVKIEVVANDVSILIAAHSDLDRQSGIPDDFSAATAICGIADDYFTSELHHPGYVLIPSAKFEQLRAAGEGLPSVRSGDWFTRNADRRDPAAFINSSPAYFASECADAIESGTLAAVSILTDAGIASVEGEQA